MPVWIVQDSTDDLASSFPKDQAAREVHKQPRPSKNLLNSLFCSAENRILRDQQLHKCWGETPDGGVALRRRCVSGPIVVCTLCIPEVAGAPRVQPLPALLQVDGPCLALVLHSRLYTCPPEGKHSFAQRLICLLHFRAAPLLVASPTRSFTLSR